VGDVTGLARFTLLRAGWSAEKIPRMGSVGFSFEKIRVRRAARDFVLCFRCNY
jgi:hypothetical protein